MLNQLIPEAYISSFSKSDGGFTIAGQPVRGFLHDGQQRMSRVSARDCLVRKDAGLGILGIWDLTTYQNYIVELLIANGPILMQENGCYCGGFRIWELQCLNCWCGSDLLAKAGERPWEMPNVRSVWMPPAKKCSEKVALEKRPFVRSHLGADQINYENMKCWSQRCFRNCLDLVSWNPNPSKGGLKLTMCTTLPILQVADLVWSSVVFHASS